MPLRNPMAPLIGDALHGSSAHRRWAMRYTAPLSRRNEDRCSPVTVADRKQSKPPAMVTKYFPNDSILAKSLDPTIPVHRVVVVDPIDGTQSSSAAPFVGDDGGVSKVMCVAGAYVYCSELVGRGRDGTRCGTRFALHRVSSTILARYGQNDGRAYEHTATPRRGQGLTLACVVVVGRCYGYVLVANGRDGSWQMIASVSGLLTAGTRYPRSGGAHRWRGKPERSRRCESRRSRAGNTGVISFATKRTYDHV